MGPVFFSLSNGHFPRRINFQQNQIHGYEANVENRSPLTVWSVEKNNVPSDSDVFIVLNEMFNCFYKRHVNYKKLFLSKH